MTSDDELNVELSQQVLEKMKEDPKAAEAVRSAIEVFRAAMQGVKEGRYKDFPSAMGELTGMRPEEEDDGVWGGRICYKDGSFE